MPEITLTPAPSVGWVEFKTPEVTVSFFTGPGGVLSRVVLSMPRRSSLFTETFDALVRCDVRVAKARVTPRGEHLHWTLDLQTSDGSFVDAVRWQTVRTALVGVLLRAATQHKPPLRKRSIQFRDSEAVWVARAHRQTNP